MTVARWQARSQARSQARWQARLVAAAVTALAFTATAVALPASPASAASAAPACPAARPVVTLQISTVPVVPRARIVVAGTPVVTDSAGRAQLQSCRLEDAGTVIGPAEPVPLAGKRRARFDRVFLSGRGSRLQVAFGVEHRVSFSFLGLPTRQITEYTLRSSTGEVHTYTDLDAVWLLGSRVLRGPDGLEEREIYYSVDSVLVAGSSVVNRSQTKFFPDERAVVRVPLLAFGVDVYVVDRLFRFPVGDRVTLRGPSGLRFSGALRNGKAAFSEVPRGSYDVVADAPGLTVARSLTLSGDQIVVLPVITWLDLLVLLGGPTALAIALILAPRPALRRRIADLLGPALRRLPQGVRPRHSRTAKGLRTPQTIPIDITSITPPPGRPLVPAASQHPQSPSEGIPASQPGGIRVPSWWGPHSLGTSGDDEPPDGHHHDVANRR
jgi:hypothetical protein